MTVRKPPELGYRDFDSSPDPSPEDTRPWLVLAVGLGAAALTGSLADWSSAILVFTTILGLFSPPRSG